MSIKVSGFTFIKNALKLDYPIIEAINSILPVCDELVVAVGKSEDDTLNYVKSVNSPKLKIIETVWDESLREGGRVLAEETDKAFRAISPDSDWAFYIQGDEVMHERDLERIKRAMIQYKDDKRVDGFVFDYVSFYGSYDFVADSRHWQKKEIRVIRNRKDFYSYKDAMSFRKGNNEKLNVIYLDVPIHHYGWVKTPAALQRKQMEFHKMWHDDEWIKKNVPVLEEFDYANIDSVKEFKGTHPEVMKDRLKRLNWKFSFDPTKAKKESLRRRVLDFIYKKSGVHIGEFKNYKIIK